MSPEAPLFIRLYLDEDVHRRVASALRLRHFDVVSAHEVRRWGLSDEEQLSYAAEEGRALFTYNAADYLQLPWIGCAVDSNTRGLSSPISSPLARRCAACSAC